jgi:hypothetical protein
MGKHFYQNRSTPCPEFVERAQPFVLGHFSIQRDGCEAEVSQDQGQFQGTLACRTEDNERIACHFVDLEENKTCLDQFQGLLKMVRFDAVIKMLMFL